MKKHVFILLLIITCVVICLLIHRIRLNVLYSVDGPSLMYDDVVQDANQQVAIITHADTYMKMWYRMVSRARHVIFLSLYTWKMEHDLIPPHIIVLAAAFRRIIKTRIATNDHGPAVQIHIMYNEQRLSMTQHNSMYVTLKYWSMCGINVAQACPHLSISFCPWKHSFFNNNHVKFLAVDRSETVLFSGNIEQQSHGGLGSWRECGLYVQGALFAKQCEMYYHHMACSAEHQSIQTMWAALNTRKRQLTLPVSANVAWRDLQGCTRSIENAIDMSENECEHLPLFTCDTLYTIFKRPCSNAFSTHRKAQNILTLKRLIDTSEKMIWIMSPTINDMCIVHSLVHAASRGVTVNILTGYVFNNRPVSVNIVRFAGHYSNQHTCRYMSSFSGINVRWYSSGAVDGCRTCSGVCMCNMSVHAKMSVFDGRVTFVGSSNLDVFSTLYSSELDVMIKHNGLSEYVLNKFIKPIWDRSIARKSPYT